MNTIVHTWEDEAIPAGEIELTDAQLAAVYGAWGEEEECEPKFKPECEEEEPHKKFEKEVKVCFEFKFEAECEEKKQKKYWN